jgi:DNA-binding CsgD family transcriptional regulator
MKGGDRGAEQLMLTASCTGHREATVTLGRFQAFSESSARNFVRRPRRAAIPALTSRENEVLRLLSAGHSYREIAERLYVSPETVHTHCKRIYRKLGVTGRRQLNSTGASTSG